ncbi:protein of unknown function [Taphrina deformans PYCC 5710]|uniref:Peptide hydrolase n=1 Tax=Taphrina deformans (strain PYCC 5710 / ATCC 11124 / CBS 356.35 / IMI 108563 / JCM 9778 / NBRC 8474) TaxID=1097556 RepID=R4XBK7_TAPDE|nr:protein of unknown function [Taphrina deformans PYCC 5710]|eukprot:CCG82970.1 protein of unknown function [Taphrina deformans PYCC 5710]
MLVTTLFYAASCLCTGSVQAQVITTNDTAFPSSSFFATALKDLGVFGLRSPASPRQYAWIDYLDRELKLLPNMRLNYGVFDLFKWQTNADKTLYEAGSLKIVSSSGNKTIDIAGAVPFSAPIETTGQIVYVPPGGNISNYNVSGKIVLMDFTFTALPYTLFASLAPASLGYYRTPDTDALLSGSYARPYTYSPEADMLSAANAGAVGFISGFNVSRTDVQSYWDPHGGLLQTIPAVYVGVEETNRLKLEALAGSKVSIAIDAFEEPAITKEIYATLPGLTKDRIIIVSHTDGNTQVQDNGGIAVLALARYFAAQPLSSRNKTLEFAFTSGHLAYYVDGDVSLARKLDFEYDDEGDVALILPMEHMGTREILARDRTNGTAGQDLTFTGRGEPMVWCVGPSTPVISAVTNAVKRRNLDNVFVMQGAGLSNTSQVPYYSSFGGIGTSFHNYLLPTSSIISGPWSLWAPQFGAAAVDIDRLRNQTLAFADVINAVSPLSKQAIAGNYTQFRSMRAAGYPTVNNVAVSQFPAGYWSQNRPYA